MYSEIQKHTDKHSVSELCSLYGVSRSGYYKWLKRAGQINQYDKTHQILDSYVLDIHSHHPMMGYRQIRDKLCLEFGWVVSEPTVWKSMKRLEIAYMLQPLCCWCLAATGITMYSKPFH